MKSVLLVASRPPDSEPDSYHRWSRVTYAMSQAVEKAKGGELIGDGCAFIPAADALPLLGAAIASAENNRVTYRVLFIDSATEWKREMSPKP